MWGKLLHHNLPTAGLLSAASFVCLFSLFVSCFCFSHLFRVFSFPCLFVLSNFHVFFWSILTPTFDILSCSIRVVKYSCKFGAIIRINSLTRPWLAGISVDLMKRCQSQVGAMCVSQACCIAPVSKCSITLYNIMCDGTILQQKR